MSNLLTLYIFSHKTGELLGTREAVEDIKQPGRFVIPPYATPTPYPKEDLNEHQYWAYLDEQGKPVRDYSFGDWVKKEKHIKVTAYNKQNQQPKQFDDKSLVDDEYTINKPPTAYHTFNTELGNWELTAIAAEKQLTDAIKTSKASIDITAAEITEKWTRFAEEYKVREAQALAFKEAGYIGECGNYITMYSTRSNKTEQEATDIILQQADGLRVLQEQLASERMRKYELDDYETLDAITAITTEICNTLKAIGDSYE